MHSQPEEDIEEFKNQGERGRRIWKGEEKIWKQETEGQLGVSIG